MNIKNILIVGGGSSGWMAAAALSKVLPNVNVTLIESKNIPIIGVGESTLTQFNEYLQLLKIKDHEWMPHCNATFKTAIRFTDFIQKGESYNDVLKPITLPDGMNTLLAFFLLCKKYPTEFKVTDFPKYLDDNHAMIEKNKMTDSNEVMKWDFNRDTAYHLDAYKFGLTMKDVIAIPHGTKHIEDDVVEVLVGENGVEGIVTKNSGTLTADLYIDCTGFKSLLLGQSMKTDFIDFSNVLMNNRAVVTNVPYDNKEVEMNSYTDCTSMENGWLWTIPTWEKLGTGYVYSDKFVDDETAKEQFKSKLRERYGDRVDSLDYRYISFVPGVRETPWNKNVLGIGLSCGFIEPLRSTGLLVTHNMITRLINILETCDCYVKNVDRESFNYATKEELFFNRDFVATHYAFAKRNDTPYWQHVTQNVSYGDSDYYKNFARLLVGKDTVERTTVPLRALCSTGYNPITQQMYEHALQQNPEYDQKLDRLKKLLQDRKLLMETYADRLQPLSTFLQQKIYQNT
jgi:tryptophan halogenase